MENATLPGLGSEVFGIAGRSALIVSLVLVEFPTPGCSVPQFTC